MFVIVTVVSSVVLMTYSLYGLFFDVNELYYYYVSATLFVIILASLGAEEIRKNHRKFGMTLLILSIVLILIYSLKFFTHV